MPDKFGDKIRLQHAFDAIDTIMGYIRDADFDVFSQDQMLRDACLRQMQSICWPGFIHTLSIPDRHDNNCPYSSSPSWSPA